MSITFSGLATGMETDSIITQLMELERAPITRMETKKTEATNRIDAYAQFKSTLDDLKASVNAMTLTNQVKSNSVSISSSAPFTATSANASSGSYNISVKQLAQVQKNISGGVASQADALLGTGTFTLTKGSVNTTITIDSTNNSLAGLAAAINENSGVTGVRAAIINDGSATSYRLALTGSDSSASFSVSSELSGGVGSVAMDSLETAYQTAHQAEAYIDGIKIVSNNNTLSNAINGVTINLNGVSEIDPTGTPIHPDLQAYTTSLLEIKPDTGALKEKLTSFVTNYNKVMEWILSGYEEFGGGATIDDDPETVDLLGSVLRGDSSVQGVKRTLQNILSSVVTTSGSLHAMTDLGITTKLNGTLLQDNSKMDAVLADNFDGAVKLLAGEGQVDGIMKKFNYYMLNVTSSTTGMYATKKANYDLNMERIDTQIANMEPRMVAREATLRAQYTAMETLVSGLNSQGSFLTQQMDLLSDMLKG